MKRYIIEIDDNDIEDLNKIRGMSTDITNIKNTPNEFKRGIAFGDLMNGMNDIQRVVTKILSLSKK
jgi:hypothetical protein